MDLQETQNRRASDKAELISHRLSDSSSASHGDAWRSQLSSISSQPTLAELSKSFDVEQAAGLEDQDMSEFGGSYQDRLCSLSASTSGPAASIGGGSSNSNIALSPAQHTAASEGNHSLKAESELLDPWSTPFEATLPITRFCKPQTKSTLSFLNPACFFTLKLLNCGPAAESPNPACFLQDFLDELGTSVEPQKAPAGG